MLGMPVAEQRVEPVIFVLQGFAAVIAVEMEAMTRIA